MIPGNQWQHDMIDGTHAACMAKKCGCGGAGLLRASIKEPIDHWWMEHDTRHRTGGRCPTQRDYLQRQFTRLEEAFEELTQSRREER